MAGTLSARLKRAVGQLAGWCALRLPGRDARRRARESEERLRLALDAAGMAIWEMDAETGAMWWSAQAGRLFGFPASGPPKSGMITSVLVLEVW